MKNAIKTILAATLVVMVTSPAAFADDKPGPQAAAAMSLSDAKNFIQRWRRYIWSDLSPDMPGLYTTEFGPVQMVEYNFPRSGAVTKILTCPYETFEPYVDSDTTVSGVGAHTADVLFQTFSAGEDGDNCHKLSLGTPSHDIAVQLATALLRWKNSTLAERQALAAQEQQQFAPIVAAYQATTPRPEIPEDVRRFRVIAETALQEKRVSDAVDAYEDGLKLAPWWPEGHFNAALALGELHYYDEAIDHMQKFIALVPAAPDARAAQDKIYAWQGEQSALPR